MRQGTVIPMLVTFCVASTLVLAVAAPTDFKPTTQAPSVPRLLPDLVITSFGLVSWGTCAPRETVFTFGVSVKNQGRASWSGVEPAVFVTDIHPGLSAKWGASVNIHPPLKEGETKQILIPIPYYSANPRHMTTKVPHPFQATVNTNRVLNESNYKNNAGPGTVDWHGIKVIMVTPSNCQK